MSDAVVVSTARTPIGKAYRGALNNTTAPTLTAHVINEVVKRSEIEHGEVEEVIVGCGRPEGTQGRNLARLAAIRAGPPTSVAAQTVSRHCASGLQAIAAAAHRVLVDNVPIVVAAGVESISLVQNDHANLYYATDDWLQENKPEIYMSMLDTAEIIAKRYNIERERQDAYALESQQRTAQAQIAGRFDEEIAPLKTIKKVKDKETGDVVDEEVRLLKDEGNRPSTCPYQKPDSMFSGERIVA